MSLRVVVTGGRDYADVAFVFSQLDLIHARTPIEALATGGATGADSMALSWANDRQVPLHTFKPDWAEYGRSAGPRRNREMLDEFKPDLVLAFPGGRGTEDCVSAAKRRKIHVMLVKRLPYIEPAEARAKPTSRFKRPREDGTPPKFWPKDSKFHGFKPRRRS